MTQLGFEVCCGERDGVAAIGKATAPTPDLVILEMESVSVDSVRVVEAIKSVLPKVPLFLIIDRLSMWSEKEALTLGVDAVFAKEADYASLLLNARAAITPIVLVKRDP